MLDDILKIIPIVSIAIALTTYAIGSIKANKLTQAAYFTKLHSELYKDENISTIIRLLHKNKIQDKFYEEDEIIFGKVIATLGFFDEICHLYYKKNLGKDEYEYFLGEIYLLLHNEQIMDYLVYLEKRNYKNCGDQLDDLCSKDFVNNTLPYTTLQIYGYINSNGCNMNKAYSHFEKKIKERNK